MKENSIEEDIKIALDKFSDNRDIDSAMLIVEKFILGNYILLGGNRGNIVKDSLRYLLSDYKRVLKENEELKNNEVIDENGFEFAVDCDWDRLKRLIDTADKSEEFILYDNEKWIKEKYCIPIQKVKNKIEELENAYWYCENVKNQTIEALEELLEESEKR